MATAPIVFGNDQESGEAALAGGSPLAINVLVDGKGAVRRRPGIATYADGTSTSLDADGIIGLHQLTSGEMMAVTNDRHIYRFGMGAIVDRSEFDPASQLEGTARPIFAENEVVVIVAGGARMQQLDLTNLVSSRLETLSTDRPPAATHVVANSSRFISNDATDATTANHIRYSRTGQVDFDEWPARYLVSAEAKPDPVKAVWDNIGEIWVFGTDTTQLFAPDPTSVYAPAKTLHYGTTAPYSIVSVDESFAWFDSFKRFVLSDGRSVKEISSALGRTLDAITTWDDCYGYRVNQDQFDCLVWTFPTDGRTFCYQLGGGWSQWQADGPTLFPVTAHAYRATDGANVVGLNDGQICQLSTDANDDLGTAITADVMTGFISRGTNARKWCTRLQLVFVRGQADADAEESVVLLSWRDDTGAWGEPIEIGLGVSGDTESTVDLTSLGVYRSRQWRLTFSGVDEWVLASATEDYEVLDS